MYELNFNGSTPICGVEPCAGPKTDVMGFARVVVECLLAMAQHTRRWTAIESVKITGIVKIIFHLTPVEGNVVQAIKQKIENPLGFMDFLKTLKSRKSKNLIKPDVFRFFNLHCKPNSELFKKPRSFCAELSMTVYII